MNEKLPKICMLTRKKRQNDTILIKSFVCYRCANSEAQIKKLLLRDLRLHKASLESKKRSNLFDRKKNQLHYVHSYQ